MKREGGAQEAAGGEEELREEVGPGEVLSERLRLREVQVLPAGGDQGADFGGAV